MSNHRILVCLQLLVVLVGIGADAFTTPEVVQVPRSPTVLSRQRQCLALTVHGSALSNNQGNANNPERTNTEVSNSDLTNRHRVSRRGWIAGSLVVASLGFCSIPLPASAATSSSSSTTTKTTPVPFGASWRAVDGLNNLNNDNNFVAFDAKAYKAMRDDPTRTPIFEKAIIQRLQGHPPKSQVVLDLGTGPFALLALIAAENGAKKVYAIEANPEAAKSARALVQQRGLGNVITIVEGFSTQIDALPELVDFCVAEIVGSIASEEGAYATIRDSHRFLKEPTTASNWIPCRIQTFASPASYTLHNLLGPPAFDWTKLQGEPVRFNCRDLCLELLSDPVLVEEIAFYDLVATDNNSNNQQSEKLQITFTIDPERIEDNQDAFLSEIRRHGQTSAREAEALAYKTAHSMSGIACWPRLILSTSASSSNDGGVTFQDLVVDSRRYGSGDHQRSHWQTVLPIMSGRPIGGLQGNEKVRVSLDFKLPNDVTVSPSYKMEGFVDF